MSDSTAKRLFIAGYTAAILDIERTGLQPFRADTIRKSAERAWRTREGER